jgi:hypothetical protein
MKHHLNNFRSISVIFLMAAMGLPSIGLVIGSAGCAQHEVSYGTEAESALALSVKRRQTWAVAPAVNLSGIAAVDPLLQADLVYQQLQQVRNVTVIPVNRVAEVYAALRIEKISSREQAELICDLLGCDALVVPTVTAYDPYNPPKFGGALQLFRKSADYVRPASVDPRELARMAAPKESDSLPGAGGAQADPERADNFVRGFDQSAGMFDAANGSVREAVEYYASGRNDPRGPLGLKEYFVSMDRYCGFAYYTLIRELVGRAGRQQGS